MSDVVTSTKGMALAEFIQRYEDEGPFELIHGELVSMSPTVLGHNKVAAELMWLLLNHVKPQGLGEVFMEAPFVLTESTDWVKGSRVPDLMFINAAAFSAYIQAKPDWESKPLVLLPDLVVEIVSLNDSYSKIAEKVELYLADGVKTVWVIDPQRQKISVHQAGSNQHITLSEADTLTAEEIMPGFAVQVGQVFG